MPKSFCVMRGLLASFGVAVLCFCYSRAGGDEVLSCHPVLDTGFFSSIIINEAPTFIRMT